VVEVELDGLWKKSYIAKDDRKVLARLVKEARFEL
jgi:hypothetical protein